MRQKLSVIGEASARLSSGFRSRHPEVEWRVLVGLRNVVVHAYFSVSWDSVWETVEHDVPDLLATIQRIREAESD